ncbi:MAG: GNAT family N-acetyltransferase [Candidatus Odinarchaeota archaeon]
MNYIARRAQSKDDMDFFFKLSFDTMMATENRRNFYDEMINKSPDASDEEIFKLHRKEIEEYFDFTHPSARVFVVETNDEEYCGYLWMGLRNSKDIWDLEKSQWIYDAVVDPKFQGKGLGKMLLQQAEEFARESNVNIGLFVHTDNTPAIALYKKMEYKIKVIPVSKKLNTDNYEIDIDYGFAVKRDQEIESDIVQKMGFERFKRKVRFSFDVDDTTIKERYEEHVSRYATSPEKHQRFVALTKNGEIAGSIWVGVSDFNEKVAMTYELLVCNDYRNSMVSEMLINSTEKWAKNEGFSIMYILLHSEDDLDAEFFGSKGYVVPGFFMEKRLKT